ncbi:hypothetical protein [uncultured Hymenobacter sp.]|uniref:hypothetical protein n=1 Tax=uncultured Hymenobacter sp. TaxID=170016 RepID=UPI0035CA4E24
MRSYKNVTALQGNVSLSIPSEWNHHKVIHGWAADCRGCSYSEPADYFGEDALMERPLTAPKKSFCTISSNIIPGSLQRSYQFAPNVREKKRTLKIKDPSAINEQIVVSAKNKTIEVSYQGRMDTTSPLYYYKSISYYGLNRQVEISFKGLDSAEFQEAIAVMRNSIRIKPAFLNQEIDE